jgi:hypothetical protein
VLGVQTGQMFMRTVKQNVSLILNRVPAVTFITDPELIHKAFYSCYDAFFGPESYGQKGEGKKVHG